MTVTLLPDVEALVSQFLRAQDEITDIVGDRVYTAIPKSPQFPLLRLQRVGGFPVTQQPLHLDAPTLQFDAYGGSKADAQELAATARSVLALRLEGVHDLGVVTGVRFGSMSWLPDPDYTPAKPRYVLDATVLLHPTR